LPLGGTRDFTAEGFQACAVDGDGGVSCWGSNFLGQAGAAAATTELTSATPVPAFAGAKSIATGYATTCAALAPSGDVVCCGRNDVRQAGQTTSSSCSLGPCVAPPAALGVSGAHQVAVGRVHACAVLDTGQIGCWGQNDLGQLGEPAPDGGPTCVNSESDAMVPCSAQAVMVAPPSGSFIQVALTDSATCGLLDDGQVLCWGDNGTEELGNGGPGPASPAPVNVLTGPGVALTGIVGIMAHATVTCAIASTGTVYCWGASTGIPFNDGGTTLGPYAAPIAL
jgi:alpha-tubulin suppressor-like RCC1 family protein